MKYLKMMWIGGLCCLASFLQVYSQQVMTLDNAIAIGLKNNYDILLSRNDSMVAALDYSYRNAVFYPRLNATTGATWNNNNQRQTLAVHHPVRCACPRRIACQNV